MLLRILSQSDITNYCTISIPNNNIFKINEIDIMLIYID